MNELADAIADALRATWAELARSGERFYGFALFTGPAFEYVLATAFSEEGLRKIAADASEQALMRWSPADSPHHCAGEAHFAQVAAILDARPDVYDLDERAFDAEVSARSEACFEALARVDHEGLFGAARAALVLNVLQGDQSDRSLRDNAARLNPPPIVERFAAGLEIREPSDEHFTLGASAYQIDALDHRAGVLAASGSGGELFAWRDNVELRVPKTAGEHWALALAHDRLCVSAGKEVLVLARTAVGFAKAQRFALADDKVRALVWLPATKTLVAASWGGRITAWREDGSLAWSHAEAAADLAVAADDRIAVAGERGVSLLDPHGALIAKLKRSPASRALSWSSIDDRLAIGAGTTVQIWSRDAQRWSKQQSLTAPRSGDVTALAFSPDGTTLAATHAGGALRVWNLADGSALERRARQESMLAVAWLDPHRLACAGRDVDRGPPVYVFPF